MRSSSALKAPSTIRSNRASSSGKSGSRSFIVCGLDFSSQHEKLGAKPSAGAMKPRFDSGYGDAQALGDLTGREPLGVFQDQYFGVSLREPSDRRLNNPLALVAQYPCERRA